MCYLKWWSELGCGFHSISFYSLLLFFFNLLHLLLYLHLPLSLSLSLSLSYTYLDLIFFFFFFECKIEIPRYDWILVVISKKKIIWKMFLYFCYFKIIIIIGELYSYYTHFVLFPYSYIFAKFFKHTFCERCWVIHVRIIIISYTYIPYIANYANIYVVILYLNNVL